jgi:hypothetical protein
LDVPSNRLPIIATAAAVTEYIFFTPNFRWVEEGLTVAQQYGDNAVDRRHVKPGKDLLFV